MAHESFEFKGLNVLRSYRLPKKKKNTTHHFLKVHQIVNKCLVTLMRKCHICQEYKTIHQKITKYQI